MISNITKTTEILKKYNLFAKKKFGQNFLIDTNICKKIADVSEIDKNTIVFEIGPGIGAMTEVLSEIAYKVICFEIDSDMVAILENELIKNKNNIEVINEDFLKVDLSKYIDKYFNEYKIIVVSNLPYYITTPIIFKLLDYAECIEKLVFMVQKEVGERLSAEPNSKDYGSLSVLIKLKGDIKKEFGVSRNCFYPTPNVDSQIVSIKTKKNDCSENYSPKFEEFIQNIFAMKRKTLCNNILSKYDINKEELIKVLNELKLSETVRAENLTLEEIKKIYQNLKL